MYEFREFGKIARLRKPIIVTEKLDGTNGQIALVPLETEEAYCLAAKDPFCLQVLPSISDGDSPLALYAGSRTRWLTIGKGDNFTFAGWALAHAEELAAFGPGRFYGEWYGCGIQRNYGLTERRFAIFRGQKMAGLPGCCSTVPILAEGEGIDTDGIMDTLHKEGSKAVPGFMAPEGIVVWHSGSRTLYKQTFENDKGKWQK